MVEPPANPAAAPPPLPWWMPRFGVQLASAFASALLFVLWVRNGWGGERATVIFTDVASTVVPLAAAGACWYRARHGPRELQAAWLLLAGGTLAWGLGQAIWTAVELRTGEPPSTPSLADAGYLLLIVLAALGVTAFVRRARPAFDPRPLLDGSIIGASFIFIAFALGLEQILLESVQGDLALIVNLLYPFGDGIVLGVVLLRLSRTPAHARGVMALLAAGFVFLAVADLWFLVVDAQGLYQTGGILDAFWIIGFQLIGLAAVRPATLEAALDEPPQTRTLALVPIYPFMVAMGVALYAEVRDQSFSDTLFWTAVVVILLVLLRLVVMLFDNFRLTARLREAQAQRTQMLNNITHDLLSPLSAVRIQLKLLQGPTLGAPTQPQDHALGIMQRNVERVVRLGSDLKDLANLEGHGLAIIPAPFDLAAEVQRAAATFREEARQRDITLTVHAPAQAPLVADAGRVGQVLDNLLSNALKFTPAGGQVALRLVEGNPDWTISVEDTGRGLTGDEMARLFQPFSQVHRPGEVKERGTGLGLYISKGIAQSHGGRLTVASKGLGRGAVFELALPKQRGAGRSAEAEANPGPRPPDKPAGDRLQEKP